MSSLDPFFAKQGEPYHHPLLRFLDSAKPDAVAVDVVRPKDVLGYKSAKIYLHWTKGNIQQPPAEYAWDDELNAELVRRHVQSVSPDVEKVRFGLALRHGFKRPEARFGDGFFNAVLGMVVREGGFLEYPEVSAVFKHISTNRPHMGGNGYLDCRRMIEGIISERARELVESLKYSIDDAKAILAGAVACYLDERFTVADRIRLGWTVPEPARG